MARNCNIIFSEIFVLGYCNIIFVWYNYNTIDKEAGCFSAGKGIETMFTLKENEKLFKPAYRIVIKSAGGVKHVISDGWDTWNDVMDYLDVITDDRGNYVDENGFEWACYVESYYVRR